MKRRDDEDEQRTREELKLGTQQFETEQAEANIRKWKV